MSINFNDRNTEARMQKALSHFNSMVRPDKQKFVSEAINHYIDSLVKSKVIKKVWLVRETTDPDLKKGMVVSLQMQYRNPYTIESKIFFATNFTLLGFLKINDTSTLKMIL